eukprot:Skav235204  [mRNA]  locus=scaffold4495:54221:55342:- [translate_table: standard]
MPAEDVIKAFKKFDKDGNGVISRSELSDAAWRKRIIRTRDIGPHFAHCLHRAKCGTLSMSSLMSSCDEYHPKALVLKSLKSETWDDEKVERLMSKADKILGDDGCSSCIRGAVRLDVS